MARRTEKADAIDKKIGNVIRKQRENMGMTQGEMAGIVGVSYQQIHKYESGVNRISAGRLGLIAHVLKLPVQYFYDGGTAIMHNPEDINYTDNHSNRLCMEVARHFRQIENPRFQEALHLLVRVMAN